MSSLTSELLSVAKTALLVMIYLAIMITCTATFFIAGYWMGSPLGGLFLQLISRIMSAPLVEPRRFQETSRRLGVLFSFLCFLCGLFAEGVKLPHPESMSVGDYEVWFVKAAVIGFMVMAAASGMVVVAGKIQSWVVGEEMDSSSLQKLIGYLIQWNGVEVAAVTLNLGEQTAHELPVRVYLAINFEDLNLYETIFKGILFDIKRGSPPPAVHVQNHFHDLAF
ncbi:hypothetical protein N431DRAFT_478838 [Stipitochalara longipes BDJ]|nr:hypothetical protein N431DRAFT_478838 [Stipitochalara longipes BDJ]